MTSVGAQVGPERCPLCSVFTDGAAECPGCGMKFVDERIGVTVGGAYRIERLLGQGGIGRVYLATRSSDNTGVAIKFLLDKWIDNHEQITRFSREAEALKKLKHAAIVELYDYGEHAGTPYMVMELVSGGTLTDRMLKDDLLPPSGVVKILAQVVDALEVAHKAHIVHRDVKPENVMLLDSDAAASRVKVLDFGIALMVKGNEHPRLTAAGEVRGTPLYMSPEQCMGRDIGPGSDIYSVGVMLYELLTGEAPFAGGSAVDLMDGHVNRPPPEMAEHGRRVPVPPTLEKIAMWSLNKRPEHRPTARQLREAFERVRPELIEWEKTSHGVDGEAPLSTKAERVEQATVAARLPATTAKPTIPEKPRRGFLGRLFGRLFGKAE